jgi:hypothetical protein
VDIFACCVLFYYYSHLSLTIAGRSNI